MSANQKSKIKNQKCVGRSTVLGGTAFWLAAVLLAGCVERRLTINTEPQGATVVLNDQQIGISPVTVPFNWYGDYWVRASKEGCETLNTHRRLQAPLYDHIGLDFFVQILYPGHITDSYEWTFPLSPKEYPTREQLIDQATTFKESLK
jgi:hypothetical protein